MEPLPTAFFSHLPLLNGPPFLRIDVINLIGPGRRIGAKCLTCFEPRAYSLLLRVRETLAFWLLGLLIGRLSFSISAQLCCQVLQSGRKRNYVDPNTNAI